MALLANRVETENISYRDNLVAASHRIQANAAEELNHVLIVDDCTFNITATRSLLQSFNLGSDYLQLSKHIVAHLE